MSTDIVNEIADNYYSDCPCIDTNLESTETYGEDDEQIKTNKNRLDFLLDSWYNLITIIDINTNYY